MTDTLAATDPVTWARGILTRAGMTEALQEQRTELANYRTLLDHLDAAQRAVRDVADRRKQTAEKLADAVGMHTWALDERFEEDGRSTYLIDGDKRIKYTAARRAAWTKDELRRLAAAERTADEAAARDLVEAQDALRIVEQRISMAKRSVEAATARLQAATTKVGLVASVDHA